MRSVLHKSIEEQHKKKEKKKMAIMKVFPRVAAALKAVLGQEEYAKPSQDGVRGPQEGTRGPLEVLREEFSVPPTPEKSPVLKKRRTHRSPSPPATPSPAPHPLAPAPPSPSPPAPVTPVLRQSPPIEVVTSDKEEEMPVEQTNFQSQASVDRWFGHISEPESEEDVEQEGMEEVTVDEDAVEEETVDEETVEDSDSKEHQVVINLSYPHFSCL